MPFLGICLGMQLLATKGEEGGGEAGLGWIDGEVVRLRAQGEERAHPARRLERSRPRARRRRCSTASTRRRDFYFVHSYHVACDDERRRARDDAVLRRVRLGGRARARATGVQFHPEKSQRAGFQVLRNFLGL